MDFVVGSYPFEEWARDVEADLEASGVDADVFYAGPRAFQVLVNKSDSDKAGDVLSGLGYLTCDSRGASLGGVFDWLPREAIEEEELKDEIKRLVEKKVEQMANAQAAMTWSTPEDYMVDKHIDPLYISDFEDQQAVNGDLVSGVQRPPEGFVLANESGRVPATEEEVELEHVARAVIRHESLNKYPPAMVKAVTEDVIRQEYKGAQVTYVNVSGETEIWVREKKDGGEE